MIVSLSNPTEIFISPLDARSRGSDNSSVNQNCLEVTISTSYILTDNEMTDAISYLGYYNNFSFMSLHENTGSRPATL